MNVNASPIRPYIFLWDSYLVVMKEYNLSIFSTGSRTIRVAYTPLTVRSSILVPLVCHPKFSSDL